MINGIYLGVAVTAFCTYVGYKYSLRYKKRRQFYADWYKFDINMKCELAFLQNGLKDITEKENGAFFDNLKAYIFNGKRNQIAFLKKSEENFFYDFCNNLGKTDSKSQQEYILSVNEKIKSVLSESEKEEKTRSVLCIKLGFLTGLAVLILVV